MKMNTLDRTHIIKILAEKMPYLKEKFGVVTIGLIGSYARNEQNESSDIDFIVEFTEPRYDFLAGLTIFLEKNFNKRIDIVRKRKNMKKSLLESSNKEVIYA